VSYRVKTVSAMTGIPRPTLLAWERRYAILDPRRTPSGYRVYSDADVELLQRIKTLVDAGHPVSEAIALSRAAAAPPSEDDSALARALRDELLAALVAWDRAAADRRAQRIALLPFEIALEELHLPLLQAIGDAWARGSISVAQEHYAAAWVREQMFAIFHALGGGPSTGPRAVCVLAPWEHHELGLLSVAIKLAAQGFRVVWLGADLPVGELVAAVRAAAPVLVCVSAMTPVSRDELVELARELRAGIDPGVVVALGGPAVAGLEDRSTDNLLWSTTLAGIQDVLAKLKRSAP
jgi:DNA-binding transcriptional MerR regulator